MDELLEDCCLHQQSGLDPVVFVEYSRLKNCCNKDFEIPMDKHGMSKKMKSRNGGDNKPYFAHRLNHYLGFAR